ncbi:MAG: hypothetical protein KDB96_02685 [Flavobacteriales bacterium]|nr:hypothetical protein [Flavobacteriales bacterium]MCB0782774.1 hypothetical protein [Flavobacteriales bacterium]MCB0808161.1 hypothetical protein [Flavobacteriales bacterium]MCB0813626.1 hypothetical protein [Flavobacteriales bacterium]
MSKVREHLDRLLTADNRVRELYSLEWMGMTAINKAMGYSPANVAKNDCVAVKRLIKQVKLDGICPHGSWS